LNGENMIGVFQADCTDIFFGWLFRSRSHLPEVVKPK
jgi:hypothetical protein